MQINENVFKKLVESASKTAIARILYEVSTEYYGDYILNILADGKVIREDDIDVNGLAAYVKGKHLESIRITGYKVDNLQKRIIVSYADDESSWNNEYVKFEEYGLH